jgi:hypothetical protein
MALACSLDLDAQLLHDELSDIYALVATQSKGSFHFHCGPPYVAEFLGHAVAELGLPVIPKIDSAVVPRGIVRES